jgi:hypothetical protein
MVDVFGQYSITGLNYTVQAKSSDSSLPTPRVDGPDTFELLLSGLHQDSVFQSTDLPLANISQLLWAGYGVTPHSPIGKRGTTIPSAVANYYLTRKIYLVRDTGVQRYNNRLPPGTDQTTGDHRLEMVTSGDVRAQLRTACPELPSTAHVYIVLTVADTTLNYSMLEAGFAGFQYLMQANELGLGGCLTAPIASSERSAIISALGLPATDQPAIIFSVGEVSTGTRESSRPVPVISGLSASGGRTVHIQYSLADAATVGLVIYDLAGRQVQSWTDIRAAAGSHDIEWNGTDGKGARSPAGYYFCRLTIKGAATETKTVRFVLVK